MALTESEKQFENWCSIRNVRFKRIDTDSQRTPDYFAETPSGMVVIEVKQIEPNEEELNALKSLRRNGFSTSDGTPGKRVRKKISKSAPQLRRFAEDNYPTVLLLYSTDIFQAHIDSYHIRTAMYGFQTICYAIPKDRAEAPYAIYESLGKGKKMTKTQNTSISALAVMIREKEELSVRLYHNMYGRNPINPNLTRELFPIQYKLTAFENRRAPDWRHVLCPA